MNRNCLIQNLLPKHIISRLVAKIANSRVTWVKNFLIRQYQKYYQIDLSEAVETDAKNYASFNAFFTRALRPETRPLAINPSSVVSPVDGKIFQIGKIQEQQMIVAKNTNFTVAQLLGDNQVTFKNGDFAVLYLAPANYHRIHMPITGKLIAMRYIPGQLFSVQPNIVAAIPNVFARNERVVLLFDTPIGKMAMILVGAVIVGSIETVWAGTVMPQQQRKIVEWSYTKDELVFARGAEVARFKLGSTVILLLPANQIHWSEPMHLDASIFMGQSLGVVS